MPTTFVVLTTLYVYQDRSIILREITELDEFFIQGAMVCRILDDIRHLAELFVEFLCVLLDT